MTIFRFEQGNMTLDEAIEVLCELADDSYISLDADGPRAIQLGIEALKRIKDMRISPCTTADETLPGETTEQEVNQEHEQR